jgi:hypothetical protein
MGELSFVVTWTRDDALLRIGDQVEVMRDPFDEPLPFNGKITGVRIRSRERIETGQTPYLIIVSVRQDDGREREIDADEAFIQPVTEGNA